MKEVKFSEQRTHEGFTYLVGVEYEVGEALGKRLLSTFPKVCNWATVARSATKPVKKSTVKKQGSK